MALYILSILLMYFSYYTSDYIKRTYSLDIYECFQDPRAVFYLLLLTSQSMIAFYLLIFETNKMIRTKQLLQLIVVLNNLAMGIEPLFDLWNFKIYGTQEYNPSDI